MLLDQIKQVCISILDFISVALLYIYGIFSNYAYIYLKFIFIVNMVLLIALICGSSGGDLASSSHISTQKTSSKEDFKIIVIMFLIATFIMLNITIARISRVV